MKILVNNVLMFLFFGLFCYQMSRSVRKWFNSRTDYGITRVDVDKIQFPSISVCTKLTLKDKEVTPRLFGNASLTEKKKLALDNIWRKNEVFQFVSHPGIFGMTYPCVTFNDGVDPGKPCHFLYMYRDSKKRISVNSTILQSEEAVEGAQMGKISNLDFYLVTLY